MTVFKNYKITPLTGFAIEHIHAAR